MEQSDHNLPELLAQDLRRHFKQLVTHYQQQLYTFALRLTAGSRQDAEDIVQEALVGAYLTLRHYPAARIQALQLRPWLYRITLNAFHHHTRGIRLQLLSLDTSETSSFLEIANPAEELPDAIFEQRERQLEIELAVSRLPERYRIAIACYYFEHLSYQEIADLLEQPLGTVKSTIHRGLGLLRNAFNQQVPIKETTPAWTRNYRKASGKRA